MADHSAGDHRRGPIGWFLGLFSSIWLAVTLLTLLFIYCSIGSAGVLLPKGLALGSEFNWVQYHIRQYRGLEMTEFEWFHWWPFDLLIGLICLNLVVTTLRRIRFKPINYGVWMIHSGIIVLALGSVYYFGTKREGDALVLRRTVQAALPGHEPVSVPVLPGNRLEIGSGQDAYALTVAQIDPQWEILSGDDAGTRAYKVSMLVEHGTDRFIRELLAGYPQYTEDVIPTGDPAQPMARARKVRGTPLVDERLELTLAPREQTRFHVMNSAALYLRPVGGSAWVQRPIRGLPRYNDYIAAPADVWPSEQLPPEPDELDIPLPPAGPDDPLGDVTLTVRRYVRYATLQTGREPGGEELDPVLSVQVEQPGQPDSTVQLRAMDPRNQVTAGGRIRFAWAETEQRRARLMQPMPPTLTVQVPSASVDLTEPIHQTAARTPELDFTAIPGTEYEYRVQRREDNVPLGQDVMVSVAVVAIRTPGRAFERWVFADPTRNTDFDLGPGGAAHGQRAPRDESIVMRYQPGAAEATFVAGPDESDLVMVTMEGGQTSVRDGIAEGDHLHLQGDTALTVLRYAARTREVTRPRIVPPSQRERNAGRFYSLITVDLPPEAGGDSVWLEHHDHVFDRTDEVPMRYPFRPRTVDLPDGRRIELLFARQRRPLPAPVVLEDFVLQTHVGGFTGSTLSVRDWISRVRFGRDEGWSELRDVQVNRPVGDGGYWFFQAQWDPPEPRQGYAGLNYTVLGVGNRNGVNIMLIGCCISVVGMIYAFYVKPIIRRRQRRSVDAAVAARDEATVEVSAEPEPAVAGGKER